MMAKREMIEKALAIERALGRFLEAQEHPAYLGKAARVLRYDKLAKQAIVIECEVEWPTGHDSMRPAYKEGTTWVTFNQPLSLDGHHGTPGKALAIIVPSKGSGYDFGAGSKEKVSGDPIESS